MNRIRNGCRSILLAVFCIFFVVPTIGSGKSGRSKKYSSYRHSGSYPHHRSYVSSRKIIIRYRIKKGDSLSRIAHRYRTTPYNIKKLNGLRSSRIYKGQILKISKNRTYKKRKIIRYRVKRGDSLSSISRKFHTTVHWIKKINRLRSSRLYRGQRLKVYKKYYAVKRRRSSRRNYSTRQYHRRNVYITSRNKPGFRWPVHSVKAVKKDAYSGVKAIGIIIKSFPGASVRSSASGRVVRVGHMRGYGKYIVVKHKNRFATVYAKLNRVTVHEGQSLKRGQQVGYMSTKSPKIHFQIDYAGKPLNPLRYLPRRKG